MNDLGRIANIKKACAIADSILKNAISQLRLHKFSTEKDVARFLRKETYKRRCKLAFLPIVATAENGAEIHHKPSDKSLKKGFLVIDFGVKYNGYCSDCTRTVYLGKPSAAEKKLYWLLLSSQETSLMNSLPGYYAADIDLISRNILLPYFKHYLHSLGHGVGKHVHTAPRVSPRSKNILKLGQVITIEPGLYFKKKLGMRIEDTILIKEQPIILTKVTKKLVMIDGYN